MDITHWPTVASRWMVVGALCSAGAAAHAIYGVGDMSGASFTDVGMLSGASCEVIGSHWVMTAKHVGGMTIYLNGTTYTADARYDNPTGDMSLLHFTNTFSSYYAPYYGNIVGQTLTYVGFGLTATLRGPQDPYPFTGYNMVAGSGGVERMMTNTAGRIATIDYGWGPGWISTAIEADLDSSYPKSPPANKIDYLGDGGATQYEGGLLYGDSGSPALIQINGQWRTVGVNVDIEDTNGPDPAGQDPNLDFGDTMYSTWVGGYQTWMQTTMNPVPEPTTIAGLTIGALALLTRRKRSR